MQAPRRHILKRRTAEELMQLALTLARRGVGRTRPNPVVGCVIAKGSQIIATGYHVRAGLPHAEVMALRVAGGRARGADMYVTLEPCNHTGRTGPCTRAILEAGIKRVVVGILDPNPLVHGKGVRCLRQHGVEVEVGVLADECRAENEAFAHYILQRRPFVVAKLAESLDGRVATRTGDSQWITSPQARREGHRLRAAADAIIVGIGTVLADDPSLTSHRSGSRDPIRVILDSQARTPPRAQVVRLARTSRAPTWIVVAPTAPLRRRQALARAGAEVIVCPVRAGRIDLRALLEELGRRELLSVLVEGGPTLVGGFFDAALVDKVHVFVAPRIIGGTGALGAVGGVGSRVLADSHLLADFTVQRAGVDLWLTGYPRRRAVSRRRR